MTRDEYFTVMLLMLGPPPDGFVSADAYNNYCFLCRKYIRDNWPPMISKLRGLPDVERKYRMWYGREVRGRRQRHT